MMDFEELTPLTQDVRNVSVTEESIVKINSDLFAKITTTDTEVKSKMKDMENRSRIMELRHGPRRKMR